MNSSGNVYTDLTRIIILIFIIGGGIALQIFLSRSKSKWPGLILPFLCVIYSLLGIFSIAAFGGTSMLSTIGLILVVFLLMNIPTAILLAIYFTVRERKRKNKEIDKMNIKDL
ncbi:MAG TPA: hypothetical protein H9688_04925 [Firmicutes bacterium]|nr:hypothetical protein [Bacillota bacterium]